MSNNTKEKMNRAYIDSKLASIFEPMVNSIFAEKPDDFVSLKYKSTYAIGWPHDQIPEGELR